MNFSEDAIFQPIIVLALWTLFVMLWMFQRRVGAFRAQNIAPDQVQHPTDVSPSLPSSVRSIGANFINLGELPVVFYAVSLAIFAAGHVDQIHIYCAWAFVATRIMHSLIHATYNRVMHRFGIYLLGALAVIIMTVREAIAVFS